VSEIRPAVTNEEWRVGYLMRNAVGAAWGDGNLCIGEDTATPEIAHAVAAVCLHGQPFGFTREDVRELRAMSVNGFTYFGLNSIADRIEALLPPEP
jgi:hypothetical protein